MPKKPAISPLDAFAEELEKRLEREGGPMLSGDNLRRALGFRSMEALRQAISRGTVPVPVFPLKNRRGKFAFASDVARWLAEQRFSASKPQKG